MRDRPPRRGAASLRLAVAALALLAGAAWPGPAAGQGIVVPHEQAFPAEGEASAATLDVPLADLLRRAGVRPDDGVRIEIHKARRRLDLLVGGRLVKSYLVNLGLAPEGDKVRQGDRRTPEGEMFVCARNARSRFHRFLALAWPRPDAAARARAAGILGARAQAAIADAHRRRDRCPPQETPLGGAVGIHGSAVWRTVPGGFELVDWTWGCVAVRDADVEELFGAVRVGTPVTVRP